ncbi:MAG: Transcriptional activator protein LuxR [Syntrophorhabdus sp. PtaB.Bin184]|nr:MAG: Transcriptional activator protein LuxR [Syntrophorhabdus sp. PtaB.Bin184]
MIAKKHSSIWLLGGPVCKRVWGVIVLLPKNLANALLELIGSIHACSERDQLIGLLEEAKRIVTCEFAVDGFAVVDSQGEIEHVGELISAGYPTEWLDRYVQERFYRVDPIVTEGSRTPGSTVYWTDTYKRAWNRSVQEFVLLSSDIGLREGYSCVMRSPDNHTILVISFAGRKVSRNSRTETIVRHVAPHLHSAMTRIHKAGTVRREISNIKLTHRETEVLKWMKEGKSRWEISVILSIGQETVKFHTENILAKLKAVNRAQAVAIAMEYGLLKP